MLHCLDCNYIHPTTGGSYCEENKSYICKYASISLNTNDLFEMDEHPCLKHSTNFEEQLKQTSLFKHIIFNMVSTILGHFPGLKTSPFSLFLYILLRKALSIIRVVRAFLRYFKIRNNSQVSGIAFENAALLRYFKLCNSVQVWYNIWQRCFITIF